MRREKKKSKSMFINFAVITVLSKFMSFLVLLVMYNAHVETKPLALAV
jgi:hypothetical protein